MTATPDRLRELIAFLYHGRVTPEERDLLAALRELLALREAAGEPVACQITRVSRWNGHTSISHWTCRACGCSGDYDAHPGCLKPAPPPAAPRDMPCANCSDAEQCAAYQRGVVAGKRAAPREGGDELLAAATRMDWQQVVLNGGPPCFHAESGKFCGRAERWEGHRYQGDHEYVSLASLVLALLRPGAGEGEKP